MTEEERSLIDQWNDNMFVSSDSTVLMRVGIQLKSSMQLTRK